MKHRDVSPCSFLANIPVYSGIMLLKIHYKDLRDGESCLYCTTASFIGLATSFLKLPSVNRFLDLLFSQNTV